MLFKRISLFIFLSKKFFDIFNKKINCCHLYIFKDFFDWWTQNIYYIIFFHSVYLKYIFIRGFSRSNTKATIFNLLPFVEQFSGFGSVKKCQNPFLSFKLFYLEGNQDLFLAFLKFYVIIFLGRTIFIKK